MLEVKPEILTLNVSNYPQGIMARIDTASKHYGKEIQLSCCRIK